MRDKGYVQVYTGNGKGKTTCMLGLTLRAVGAEKKVYIGQFLKEDEYSEIKALNKYLPQVKVEQYGGGKGFVSKDDIKNWDMVAAGKGYRRALEILESNKYDIVILDELNVAVYMGLIEEDDVITMIKDKPQETELIITGRYATDKIIESSDLVTEMKEIKHYYKKGVLARKGIEE